jgi:GNAT superfamily N-acetyltransferase
LTADDELIDVIDTYLDAVPRSSAEALDLGPFTLFRSVGPWPYYARPRRGLSEPIHATDVLLLREEQRTRGVPEAIEWVHSLTPSLAEAAATAGLEVAEYPLMVLERRSFTPASPPDGVTVRLLAPDDELFEAAHAVASVGFGVAGTSVGSQGAAERDAAALATAPALIEYRRLRHVEGLSHSVVAVSGEGAIGIGTHQPVGHVTEVVGVATLPAWRRQGIGVAVTSLLVADAYERGIDTVFLSAGDADIARVYARLGFRRIGSAGGAEPAAASHT